MSTPDPLKETLRALIPPPVEMTLERIAYHESGHVVAAIKLGWAVESVSIIPDGDRLGVCHQRRPDGATVTVPGSRIDRHGIICRLTEEELQKKAQAKADRRIETATATFMMAGKAAERIRWYCQVDEPMPAWAVCAKLAA